MSRRVIWVSLFCLSLAACPGRVPSGYSADPQPGFVRITTWNVHDLFDEHDQPAPPGEEDTVFTSQEVDEKLYRVGQVLTRIDADLVVLQEVENLPLLERLASGPLVGQGYQYLHLTEGNDRRGIDIGVLSRLPLSRVVNHLNERDPEGGLLWSRDLVELHIGAGPNGLVLLANHFVSQAGDNDASRTWQAERARELADELAYESPDALLAILGDLNDEPDSAPLRPLLGDGTYADLASELPAADNITYVAGSFRSRLDYVLVHRQSLSAIVYFEIVTGDDVAAASDHRPVVADLILP